MGVTRVGCVISETYQEYRLQVAARTSRGYGERSDPPATAVTDVKGRLATTRASLIKTHPLKKEEKGWGEKDA